MDLAQNLNVECFQLKRTKGWRMPEGGMKVDRTTPWGNPFRSGKQDYMGDSTVLLANGMLWIADGDWTIEDTVVMFEQFARGHAVIDPSTREPINPNIVAQIRKLPSIGLLRGRKIGCWCRIGSPCHRDVLSRLVEETISEEEDAL